MSPALGLLERDQELDRLAELIEAVAEDRGGAAAVVGAAGIGKTSLLAAAGERASDVGLERLDARGGELEQDFPFGIARQLFEVPLRRLSAEERDAALEGAAAHALAAFGTEGPDGATGVEGGFAVVHGLYWLTANLAERRPLAIVVDDLHWADSASLRFLAYLARRIGELPIIVLVAARPAVESPHAEVVESLLGDPAFERIAPGPLSADATGEVIHTVLGAEPEAEFTLACHEATAGNPFLCEQLARGLADDLVEPVAREARRVGELASGGVATAVVGRLGRLASEAAALARAVAILGTQADGRHAAALAGLDPEAAAGAASSLAAQGILREGPTPDFAHPLVRTAVRERIPAPEQVLLHERAARLLAEDGAPPERIAVHLLAIEPVGEAWAVESLRDAAREVESRGDPGAAVGYLRRASREPCDDHTRLQILRELGLVEVHAGEHEPAAEHLREAHRLADDPMQRAELARDLALALRTPGRYEEGASVLRETIEDIQSAAPDLALALEADLHQSAMMQPATYAGAGDRLGRIDPGIEGATHGERAILAALATEGALRTESAASVRDWATRAFDRGLLADQSASYPIWINAIFPLIFADGLEVAKRVSADAIADARRRGSPVGMARAHTVSTYLHFRRGEIREAEADARTATEVGREAGWLGSVLAVGVLLEALVERGELDEAEAVLANTGLEQEIPELFVANWVLLGRGLLRSAQAKTDEAIADLEELRRRGEQGWHPWNPAMYAYRSPLALTLLRGGAPEKARELAEEELELSRRWDTPRVIGMSLRTLGQVSGGEPGLKLLRESVGVLDGSTAPLENARSLVALGEAIAQTGKRVEAREPLHAGMELAHRLGAAALSERAREQLVAAGARPRRIMRTGLDALTPSELRVARLAADGLTNREIAQALFVTMRTVEVHLTHTYQKLDIASRQELPEALAG